jgi:hypothetical protein
MSGVVMGVVMGGVMSGVMGGVVRWSYDGWRDLKERTRRT